MMQNTHDDQRKLYVGMHDGVCAVLSPNAGKTWQHLTAIGADDAMVVAMDWDPSNPQRVYAGTDRGAVFCSQDRGVSWEPLPITLRTIAVGALVVGPV